MNDILHKFITEPLFDATAAMLSHLHIRFTPQSKTPIPFEGMYADTTSSPMPKALKEVVNKVADTYLIGAIDADTLDGRESEFDIDKPLDGKYQTMLVFAVDIKPDVNLTRSELATLSRGFNRMAPQLPVVVFVRTGNTLSLATCERSEYRQDWREGEKIGKVSILRNINCARPHRGHLDILASLGDKAYPTFDALYEHWLEVFSSELLTKKFYTELSEWYAWVINSGKVKFPNDITTTEDDTEFNHESVIRLITRLIFVWFLKQKSLIPEDFFDEKAIGEKFIENFDPHSINTLFYNPEESKYYRLILQNLFFAMLNRPILDDESGNEENRRFVTEKRFRGMNSDYNINNLLRYRSEFKEGGADKLLQVANSQVPFLNGGLFECLDDKDSGMYYDGFSERRASLEQLSFPDYFFFGEKGDFVADLSEWYDDKKKKAVPVTGLINILNHYNFTVEENTPLDQEVSLDPELLGKVFENLLASYNPETNTTARKQTGSFYTPRDIVKYMVDESLIAHLKRTCPSLDESVFRSLFDYSVDNFDLPEADRRAIMTALYNCKVLDPACGSGAFPMGVLQQMVHALRKLDPTNAMWREFILEISLKKDKEAYEVEDEDERNRLRSDIEQAFNRNVNDPDYARKLYLIENCIYGVDIQPIATQISKLRFFISLVAEQKPTSDAASNFGIRPLPYLEAKFVSANTLLPLEKESTLFDSTPEIKKIKKNLVEANHAIFRAKNNHVKRILKTKIEKLRQEYVDELFEIGSIGPTSSKLIAEWDMFNQNHAAKFFDAEWMFCITDGFDIVIGNPPYVQLQKSIGKKGVDKKGKTRDLKLGDLYEHVGFETFAKTGDIYCLFYEGAINMLKPGGYVCFITSNKWMRAGYGEKLRGFFASKTNPEILIDFGGVQIFESATVDTNILLAGKANNEHKTLALTIGKDNSNGITNLSDFVRQNAIVSDFSNTDSWVILSPIEQSIKRKIEAVGTPLKDWDIQINYGIKTGFNDAFIISTEKRDEILAKCADDDEREKTAELIRPILRGRDIKRYGYDWAGLWLINTHNGIKGKLERIHIEDYPAVKAHLDQYWDKISTRADKGDTPYNLRNCAYLDDFSKPKIVWKRIGSILRFSYDGRGCFGLDSTCFASGSQLAYLACVLNSKIGHYLLKDSPCTGTGDLLR